MIHLSENPYRVDWDGPYIWKPFTWVESPSQGSTFPQKKLLTCQGLSWSCDWRDGTHRLGFSEAWNRQNFEVKRRFTEICIMWLYFLKNLLYSSLMYSKLIEVSLKAVDQIIFIKWLKISVFQAFPWKEGLFSIHLCNRPYKKCWKSTKKCITFFYCR